jgi:large subunit ribosomal protein L10
MATEVKKSEVEELAGLFKKSNCAIIAEYRGVKASEISVLRRDLRRAGGKLRVVKNTLARLAAQGTDFKAAEGMFNGPVSIAFGSGEDVSKPAKMMLAFAKGNANMKILGGVLEGSVLDKEGVGKLASTPPKPVLQAMFLGLLQAPARNFVGVLAAVPKKMLYALNAIADKKNAG